MRGARAEFAEQVVHNLRRSLEDCPLTIQLRPLTRMFGQVTYVIQVDLTPDCSLVFSPWQLDNGANGIDEAALVQIRRAAGQAIDLPVRRRRSDGVWTDIVTLDTLEPSS